MRRLYISKIHWLQWINVHWCRVFKVFRVWYRKIIPNFFDKNGFAIRIHLANKYRWAMKCEIYTSHFSVIFLKNLFIHVLCTILSFTIIYKAKFFISVRFRLSPLSSIIIEFFLSLYIKIYVKKLIFEHTKDRIKHFTSNLETCCDKWILARR